MENTTETYKADNRVYISSNNYETVGNSYTLIVTGDKTTTVDNNNTET